MARSANVYEAHRKQWRVSIAQLATPALLSDCFLVFTDSIA